MVPQPEPAYPLIRAAIVDDGSLGPVPIRELLDGEDDVEVVGEYEDPESACAGLGSSLPDLLVLAVCETHASAFTVLESFPDNTAPATIFVTDHDRGCAVRAFDYNAVVDYVLQPFDAERFQRSVERARRHIVAAAQLRQPAMAQRTTGPEYLSRLAVKTRGKVYLLRIEEIEWIEAAGNYVRLHAGGEAHLYRDSLVDFESRIDPRRFVRIHRSNIVNIDSIAQLEPSFHREHVVLLRDGTRLTLTAPYRGRMRAMVGGF
jgi:two-component system, LytTR family, response regulator